MSTHLPPLAHAHAVVDDDDVVDVVVVVVATTFVVVVVVVVTTATYSQYGPVQSGVQRQVMPVLPL